MHATVGFFKGFQRVDLFQGSLYLKPILKRSTSPAGIGMKVLHWHEGNH